MSWKDLTAIYKESGIVLAFGSGVSLGSGLPSWLDLLKWLADEHIGSGGSDTVEKLRAQGFTLPAIASMIRAQMKSTHDFPDLVRKQLYKNFEPYKELEKLKCDGNTIDRELERVVYSKLVKDVQEKNDTLRAVSALCAKWSDGERLYVSNPKIHGIVNFNVDAIFRVYMAARYRKANYILVRTVERPNKKRDPNKISVYHMHGYLRFDDRAGDRSGEASDKLVLGEEEYFDFFNSPTSIFNYTFLHLLREYTCLFIGLSMQDDNIRRLLHYSRKERLQGYEDELSTVDEKKKADKLKSAKLSTIRHFSILKHSESRQLDKLHEAALRNLGTAVLWISDFKELPNWIGEVYSSTGDSWSSVYNSD
jgi:hypothetical protein